MFTNWHCVYFHTPIPEHLKEFIKELREVYIFDKSSRTHCCELRPSYELIALPYSIIFVDGLSERKQEGLEEMFYENPEDCYKHCSYVDSLPKEQFDSYGEIECDEDNTEYDIREEVREYYQCNPKF